MYLLIILLSTNFILASYGGGYAGSGLRYASNAREFALSGSLIADKQNGFSSFSNPASIRLSRKNIIGMSIQNLSLDRSNQSFNYSKQHPPSAAVGIAFLRSGISIAWFLQYFKIDCLIFEESSKRGLSSVIYILFA